MYSSELPDLDRVESHIESPLADCRINQVAIIELEITQLLPKVIV
jgi:hypothetical protein